MKSIRRDLALSDVVTSEIRGAILDGTLAPGSRIRQEELAARLGVSRAPIRHALTSLAREGLVQTKHYRGAIVAPLDPEFIKDVYEFRAAVDAYVAASLATRGAFDSTAFQQIINDGRAAGRRGDLPQLIELDLRFHIGLYEALGNQVTLHVMRTQWSHIRRVMAAALTVSGYAKRVWDDHAAILDAIARHQVRRAADLATAHIDLSRTVVMKGFRSAIPRLRAPAVPMPGRRTASVQRETSRFTTEHRRAVSTHGPRLAR